MTSPRFLRFVQVLALGGMGVMRGCGFGHLCSCPRADGSMNPNGEIFPDGQRRDFRSYPICTAADIDAGCITEQQPSGPLLPPELA